MASVVDICNTAYEHLSHDVTIVSITAPTSVEEARCAVQYPKARDKVLASHRWDFASTRATIAAVAVPSVAATSWAYAYRLPADCLMPFAILPPDYIDENTDEQPFVVEIDSTGVKILYTNVQDAILRYVVAVTDTTKFSPLCVSAIEWLLASNLAGKTITGSAGIKMKQACYSAYLGELEAAKVMSANGQSNSPYNTSYLPKHLQNR